MKLEHEWNGMGHPIDAFLAAARRMWNVAPEQAERIYRQAEKLAEQEAGKSSPLAGVVLVDLMRFYEHQGRDEEAEQAWEQIRRVVVEFIERRPEILESVKRGEYPKSGLDCRIIRRWGGEAEKSLKNSNPKTFVWRGFRDELRRQ